MPLDGYESSFRRARHPLLAHDNTWTWRFLPGVLLGFAIKWWVDAGNKASRRSSKSQEPKKVLASKAVADPNGEEYKMVLCVNDSLKMGKGKIAAQCAHAAVGVVEQHRDHAEEVFAAWELKGHAKVALRVPTEPEMLEIARAAEEQHIFTYLVVDAGRTQIAPGSRTVLAVGPAPKSAVDRLTGHLKLL